MSTCQYAHLIIYDQARNTGNENISTDHSDIENRDTVTPALFMCGVHTAQLGFQKPSRMFHYYLH